MKKKTFTAYRPQRRMAVMGCLLACAAASLTAQDTVPVAGVDGTTFKLKDNRLTVGMNLDLTPLDVKSDRAVLISPVLVNGTDSVALPEVGVYGRNRYYYYVRNGRSLLTATDAAAFRSADRPASVPYSATTDYREWMNGARLKLSYRLYGCCSDVIDEDERLIARWSKPEPFRPKPIFIRPEAEASKDRRLERTAYIDFRVNRTDIVPQYHRNTAELAKIQATIDSVRADRDVTIRHIAIKGYASPEAPYKHNAALAEGRTQALKEYVRRLYNFDESLMGTAYEPENWEGLRRAVEQGDLPQRDRILALIDSDREPDNKEWVLKRDYPEQYAYLLKEVYPYLRRSDYRIEYTIRSYTDVEEIKRVLRTRPQNLSLNELYLAAQTLEEGSEEYNEVFETAVRMYPEDPTANLNAANVALKKNDLPRAERLLAKAGDTAQAAYAKGTLAFLKADYAEAARLMETARAAGIAEAAAVLEEIRKVQ